VDGTYYSLEFSGTYDGKDNAIKGDAQYGDVVALTRVDANTTRSVYKNGVTVTVTMTSVVSGDGKTMTVTIAGTNAKGTPIDSVAVYTTQGSRGGWSDESSFPAHPSESSRGSSRCILSRRPHNARQTR
jgi:hypothetical protein